MKSKSVYVFFLLAFASVCLAQTPSDSASQENLAQNLSVLGETNSPLTLHALVLKLNNSFQALSQARDSHGYVKDEFLFKTHSTILRALENTIRSKRGKSHYASPSQRRELQAALQALDDSFGQLLLAHDNQTASEYYAFVDAKDAFSAHDAALKRLNQTLKDIGLNS
jgi:hypothetical protein